MLWRDINKCFSKSKGRFISILLLVALGSFALVGLQVTGSDMRKTGESFLNSLNAADISIIGDYGIDLKNTEAINAVSGAEKIEYGYLKDAVISGTDDSIRIFSVTDGISEYKIVSGRMPQSDDEIALVDKFSDKYNIGDVISFSEKADVSGNTVLKYHDMKIVGFINSGELLSYINMGQSTAGTGELQGYAAVMSGAFDSDVFMIARLTFTDTKNVDPYSSEYADLIHAHKAELENLLADQPALRFEAIKTEYLEKIDDAKKQIDDGEKELSDALDRLNESEAELSDAKQKYEDGLAEYEKQKNDAYARLADAEKQLSDAKAKIADGEKQLADEKVKYEDGIKEYENQKAEAELKLSESKKKLDEAAAEIEKNESQLEAKRGELSAAEKTLAGARKELDSKTGQYNTKLSELETKKAELKGQRRQLDTAEKQLSAQITAAEKSTGMTFEQIEENLPILEKTLPNEQYESLCALVKAKKELGENADRLSEAEKELVSAEKQLEESKAALDAAGADYSKNSEELSAAKDQLSAAETELLAAKQSYFAGVSEYDSGKAEADAKLSSAKSELDAAASKISESEAELSSSKAEYNDGMKEYKTQKASADKKLSEAKTELDDAAQQIADGEKELSDGWSEYNEKKPDAEAELADAREKVDEAQNTIDNLKPPQYAIDSRREIPGSEGYRIYGTISEIVDSLADVFPIFLYFVAALVTLTTMTRFVDEERINSGTLKALGYTNRDIVKKFTVYGLSASMSGAVLGIVSGHILISLIVYNAYKVGLIYPRIELHFYPVVSVIAIVLAFACAVLPAGIVAEKSLREKPSELLMPKAPKAGSKIMLERIKPIWNHMSFTHKVTARNIFRYKKRMFMTIFGVCGSVTLIFAGFSVQNSISGVKDRQFGEIMKYDLIVAQNAGIGEKQQGEIDELLMSDDVSSYAPVHYETVTKIAGKKGDRQQIKLIVPEDSGALSEYISLINRKSGKSISLTDNGCVISERLSEVTGASVGDAIEFTDADGNQQSCMVSGITEMYTGHFIFMSKGAYESSFDESYASDAYLITLSDRLAENAKAQASRFIELDCVKGVVQNTTMTNQIDTIVHSLNKIMEILIIVAIMLAVVILYNLTNINVAERIRELSTIKVLGFYNKEVTMYIYRETIILTILGILTGFGFGDLLYRYILAAVPPDDVMFNPALGAKAFVIPVIVVSLITFLLGLLVNKKLKNIDMLGALKSVD